MRPCRVLRSGGGRSMWGATWIISADGALALRHARGMAQRIRTGGVLEGDDMSTILRVGAIALIAGGAGLVSMASCAEGVESAPDEDMKPVMAGADDTDDGRLSAAEEALQSCGVANVECCPGNCCHDGSECVYRTFQANICRKPPVPGSVTVSCNSCGPIHLLGCGGALAACAAACAVTGPGCAACFAAIGSAACITCVHH